MRVFKDVQDFLDTAKSILNRRNSRAGHALENHVEFVLKDAAIPHKVQPKIDGEPDVIIPGEREYYDDSFPVEKLFILGIKTSCKDRWRQVVNEAKRVPEKHILTLQAGISVNQLNQMYDSKVKLIVPKSLHKEYPKTSNITLYTVEDFLKVVRNNLNL